MFVTAVRNVLQGNEEKSVLCFNLKGVGKSDRVT